MISQWTQTIFLIWGPENACSEVFGDQYFGYSQEGLMLADDFINKQINSNEVSFHCAISRNKTLTFSKTKKKLL